MQRHSLPKFLSCCAFMFVIAVPHQARADDVQSQLDVLESRLDEQEKLIEDQQRMLNSQEEEINKQKRIIEALNNPPQPKKKPATQALDQTALVGSAVQPPPPHNNNNNPAPQQANNNATSITPPTAEQTEVNGRPQVEALADQGGILSPKGMLTYENTLEYTNTTRNLFTFNGVELAQVVLVGAINTSNVRHQIVQEAGRLRLGLTNRLEADVHAPFVYRNDSLANTQTTAGAIQTSSIEGADLGDIDAGIAYQLNDGKEGWPFLIGNLRYKANNAEGPYDVPYDSNNIAKRLPTGTGFQTAEASVTAIKVSDPAVLFANLGYVYDVPRNIDHNFNSTFVGRVEPGDAINALFGVAFSINQDTSFSLGYKHSYVFPTTQHSTDTTTGAPFSTTTGSSQVGALTVGLSYAVTPATSINVNLAAGVTNDAPDLDLMVRVPFQLGNVF